MTGLDPSMLLTSTKQYFARSSYIALGLLGDSGRNRSLKSGSCGRISKMEGVPHLLKFLLQNIQPKNFCFMMMMVTSFALIFKTFVIFTLKSS